jgi:hypothetical protein
MAEKLQKATALRFFSMLSTGGAALGVALAFASRYTQPELPPEAFRGLDPLIMLGAVITAASLLLGTTCAIVFLLLALKRGLRP